MTCEQKIADAPRRAFSTARKAVIWKAVKQYTYGALLGFAVLAFSVGTVCLYIIFFRS